MAYNIGGFQDNGGFQVTGARVPYGMGRQYGSAMSLGIGQGNGLISHMGRPDHLRLGEYERALLTDDAVASGLEFIKLAIMSSVRGYYHPDARVQQFVTDALKRMSSNWRLAMGELVMSSLWAGFGVSESSYAADNGMIWLSDIANYNPRSIQFHVNQQGKLTEGETALFNSGFTTGIWQDNLYGMPVRIPMRKSVVVTHNRMYGNYYGESLIRRVYKNWRLKEVVLELWNIALDRHGTPIIYMILPPGDTGREIADPFAPGGYRAESLNDAGVAALQNLHTGSGLVMTRPQAQDDVTIGALTTGNNFGDTFVNAVKYYNRAIWRGFMIPQLLLQENDQASLGSGAAATHFKVFKMLLQQLAQEIIEPFTEQVIGRLVRVNFANITDPGHFILTPSDPETASALVMQMEMLDRLHATNGTIAKDINAMRVACDLEPLSGKELEEVIALNNRRIEADLKAKVAASEQALAKKSEVEVKRFDAKNRGQAALGQIEIAESQLEQTRIKNEMDHALRRQELLQKARAEKAKSNATARQNFSMNQADLEGSQEAADRIMEERGVD